MRIQARAKSDAFGPEATVTTEQVTRPLTIPPREGAPGSGLNGGELLFLALATCYGNDIWREAAPRGIDVVQVEVVVEGEFGNAGEPARSITYRVRIDARAPEDEIAALIRHTDGMAEIQNTIRQGMPVELVSFEAVSISD